MKIVPFTGALLLLTVSTAGRAGIFGPSNYDECVLSSMKGVTSDVAARAIMRSCREKFASNGPASVPLPPAELALLDGRGQVDLEGSNFFGSIYNGSKDWTVTAITVRLTPRPNPRVVSGKPRDFILSVTVGPLSNATFFQSIGSGEWGEVDWAVLGASGYRK